MAEINHKNIFLIGFMGAGKTTVGKILAKRLGLQLIDLDETIEKELKLKISEIFSKHGEFYFRDVESKTLESTAEEKGQVVSTGGGIVIREENWEVMKREGVTIYLKASPEVLWTRVKGNKSRPLLQVENPFERLCELLSSRTFLYDKADLVINTEDLSPEEVAEEIVNRVI